MKSLDVTVIIPVRNGADFICEALESVFMQSEPPAEIVVVDDGSTDGTREIIQLQYGSRVRIIDGPQTGAGPARNVGVMSATTRLIAFLDADDRWHPEKLARQLSVFEPGTVLGTYADFFVSTKTGQRFFGTSIRTQTDQEADRLVKTGSALPALLSSWLFERESFIAIGAFDPDYVFAQDFEIAIRFSINGFEFRVIRESLLDYRIHQTSETFTNYVSQRMFADFSKYKHITLGELGLDQWSNVFWSRTQVRRAKAGFYFRLGLGGLGQTVPLRALALLALSLTLDPKGFVNKLKKQSDVKLLLRNKKF